MSIPSKFIDTSLPGVPGSKQLLEPPNPEYIKYILEENKPSNRMKAMRLVMLEYRGVLNPAIADKAVEEYFNEE